MFSSVAGRYHSVLVALSLVVFAIAPVSAQNGNWRVSKSSGDVWIGNSPAQQVALSNSATLAPGDNVRTGRTGRVLLVRGEEAIMVSPNSAVSLPAVPTAGLRTTILHQAGTILIQAEKRDERHFQIETPYLAAVVKGTRFRVTVDPRGAKVDVLQGRVEVSDFRSGQTAMVNPGQVANVLARGASGLKLGGAGVLGTIERGQPRPAAIRPIAVPRGGFTGPDTSLTRRASTTSERQSASAGQSAPRLLARPNGQMASVPAVARGPHNGLRITAPLGEVKVNMHQVSRGLAQGGQNRIDGSAVAGNKGSVWNSGELNAGNGAAATVVTNSGNSGASAAVGSSTAAGSSSSSSSARGVSSTISDTTTAVSATVNAAKGSSTVSATTTAISTAVGSTSGISGSNISGSSNSGNGNSGSGNSGAANALNNGQGKKVGSTK